jgi:hypothetical protein
VATITAGDIDITTSYTVNNISASNNITTGSNFSSNISSLVSSSVQHTTDADAQSFKFDAEFNDTFTASWESKSRTTDYRRPLLIRQNDSIGIPVADRYGSRDSYSSSDYSRYGAVMPFHKPSTHMPPNAVNQIQFDTIAAQFDLTDIPNDAVITAAKVKIVVQQKSGGMDTPRSPYNYGTGVAGGTPITDGSYYGRIEASFSASSADNVFYGILDGTSDAQAVLRDDTLQTLVFNLYTDYNYPTGLPQYSNFDTFDIDQRPFGPLGTHPIVNIKLSSVYPTPFTGGNYSGGVYGAYEFHNIALQIEYTGRAYNTTGFIEQPMLSTILPSDELDYRNTHFLLGATGVPAYGLGFTYSSTRPTTHWHIGTSADDDILDIENGGTGNGSWGSTSNGANPSSYQDLWFGNTSKELLMIGSTNATDYRTDGLPSITSETLSISDVRDSGFKIHRYNYNNSTYESPANTWPLFTPRYNVAYLDSMGGIIDLDVDVSLAATPILFHRNTADEIDDFAIDVSTTTLGGFLLDDSASDNFSTAFAVDDLQNTGLVFAGEANLSAGFTSDFEGDLAITGVIISAFDTTVSLDPDNTGVLHTTGADAQTFDFNITKALGGIIRSSTIFPVANFSIADLDNVYLITQPTLQQTHTEQTLTRQFTIQLQGEDRAHERTLYIDQQTRTFTIQLEGEDRAHERHLYIDEQTRTITAEALEE